MSPTLELAVDEDAREVVVRMGPFMASNAMEEPRGQLARFTWPVEGWLHGFRVRLVDVEGNDAPRDILRELVAINFDRDQVIRPELERLSGVGSETDEEEELPQDFSVPLVAGQRVALYASLHDDTGRVPAVYVLVTIAYTPPEDAKGTPVFDPTVRIAALVGSFQGPPGRTGR